MTNIVIYVFGVRIILCQGCNILIIHNYLPTPVSFMMFVYFDSHNFKQVLILGLSYGCLVMCKRMKIGFLSLSNEIYLPRPLTQNL